MSDTPSASSEYLNQPLRPAERRAFQLAINALQEIAEESTTMGPEHTAEAALELIRALVPEALGERR